MQIFKIITRL